MNGLCPPLHINSSSVSYDAAQTPMNSVQKPERKGDALKNKSAPPAETVPEVVLGEEQNILFKEKNLWNEKNF